MAGSWLERSPVSEFSTRPATFDDAGFLARVYNHYVLTSTATFDTEPKDAEERRAWLASHGERYPVIIGEVDSQPVGFASLTAWSARSAWSRTAEVGVYLDSAQRGQGLGPLLLSEIVECGRRAGHHVLLSQIVGDNLASLAMAEKAGFRRVGVLEQVGHKFDRWLDVVLFQLVLEDQGSGRGAR